SPRMMMAALQFTLYAGLEIAAQTPSAMGLMSKRSSLGTGAARQAAGSKSRTNNKKRDFMRAASSAYEPEWRRDYYRGGGTQSGWVKIAATVVGQYCAD